MDGFNYTKHFEQRFAQRGLTAIVIETLLRYGSARKIRDGAESIIFTRKVLAEIRTDLGDAVFKACDRLKNAYIVLSADGTLVTVAHSYRKVVN